MFMLQYFPETLEEVISMELFDKINETPLIKGLPTMFYFEGFNEYKAIVMHYPSKIAELVYKNLQTFKDRGWNAVIASDDKRGIIHVFFGENKDEVKVPVIMNCDVIGNC